MAFDYRTTAQDAGTVRRRLTETYDGWPGFVWHTWQWSDGYRWSNSSPHNITFIGDLLDSTGTVTTRPYCVFRADTINAAIRGFALTDRDWAGAGFNIGYPNFATATDPADRFVYADIYLETADYTDHYRVDVFDAQTMARVAQSAAYVNTDAHPYYLHCTASRLIRGDARYGIETFDQEPSAGVLNRQGIWHAPSTTDWRSYHLWSRPLPDITGETVYFQAFRKDANATNWLGIYAFDAAARTMTDITPWADNSLWDTSTDALGYVTHTYEQLTTGIHAGTGYILMAVPHTPSAPLDWDVTVSSTYPYRIKLAAIDPVGRSVVWTKVVPGRQYGRFRPFLQHGYGTLGSHQRAQVWLTMDMGLADHALAEFDPATGELVSLHPFWETWPEWADWGGTGLSWTDTAPLSVTAYFVPARWSLLMEGWQTPNATGDEVLLPLAAAPVPGSAVRHEIGLRGAWRPTITLNATWVGR